MEEWLDEVLSILEDMLENGEDIPDALFAEISDAIEEIDQTEQRPIEAPLPTGTDLLWHLANGNPEAFVGYLRTVPDPALNQLLRNPDELRELIATLQEQFPQAEPENIQGVEKAPLNSSNIWGFSYDPSSSTLRVRFQGDGIYQYKGVPPYIFRVFQAGAVPAKTNGRNQYGQWWKGKMPSLGAALFELIKKGGYPYQKVA